VPPDPARRSPRTGSPGRPAAASTPHPAPPADLPDLLGAAAAQAGPGAVRKWLHKLLYKGLMAGSGRPPE
jgi:hypothetical protein